MTWTHYIKHPINVSNFSKAKHALNSILLSYHILYNNKILLHKAILFPCLIIQCVVLLIKLKLIPSKLLRIKSFKLCIKNLASSMTVSFARNFKITSSRSTIQKISVDIYSKPPASSNSLVIN